MWVITDCHGGTTHIKESKMPPEPPATEVFEGIKLAAIGLGACVVLIFLGILGSY
jgi:hypothetical protein